MTTKTRAEETKVAWITGASSGIGRAVAIDFAARGYRVALLARRTDRLEETRAAIEAAGGQALTFAADVTQPESLQKAVEATKKAWGRIDLVLANAGFAVSGPVHKLTVDDYRRQFETNVFGVLHTVYATREALLESRGTLAIIGSIAGQLSVPYNTAYSMSKFAVRALALGLRKELRKKGVDVVLISPGFIGTEIDRVDNEGRTQKEAVKKIPSQLVVPLEKAAPAIVRAILARRGETVITGHGKVLCALNRYCPPLLDAFVSRM